MELVVNKAAPVVTWNTPAAITYGMELSDAQLNATTDIEGTFEYNPAIGAKLNAGTQTLTATFTPADSENYDTASASVELVVNKAAQTIEFAPLADVREGDEPFELSATASSGLAVTYTSSDPEVASVQGSLVTIGLAGTTTITAVQEGNDNYEAAEATQTLTVLPASDFIYVVNEDGTLTIIGYRGTETDLVIPDVIDEMTVTIIGEDAFKENTTLRSVVIPETVILIDSQAFAGCTALEEITIPASVEAIGDGAFSDCPALTKVDFMGKVPALPEDVFSGSENVVIYYFMKYNDPDDLPANVKKVAKDQISLTYEWKNGELILTFTGTLYESEDTVTWTPVEDVSGSTYIVKPTKGKKFYRVGM